MPVVDETQPVAILKRRRAGHIERAAAQLLHLAHILAHRFRRVEASDVVLAAFQKIIGETAIECLSQIGLERIVYFTVGSAPIVVGAFRYELVQPAAIRADHVLHVFHIFQSAFDLERAGAAVGKQFEMVNTAHVAHRQQIALTLHRSAGIIQQVELHSAELRTGPTICASVEAML